MKELNLEIPQAKIDQSRPIQGLSSPKNAIFLSSSVPQPKPIQEIPEAFQQPFPDPIKSVPIETPPRPIPTQEKSEEDPWTDIQAESGYNLPAPPGSPTFSIL